MLKVNVSGTAALIQAFPSLTVIQDDGLTESLLAVQRIR
eukprot:COSAG04_NODE_18076_length_451_cov_1.272727_1_plen_38_part_10